MFALYSSLIHLNLSETLPMTYFDCLKYVFQLLQRELKKFQMFFCFQVFLWNNTMLAWGQTFYGFQATLSQITETEFHKMANDRNRNNLRCEISHFFQKCHNDSHSCRYIRNGAMNRHDRNNFLFYFISVFIYNSLCKISRFFLIQ